MIFDENGNEIPPGSNRAGNICVRNPWPGLMQTIWGDPEKFKRQVLREVQQEPQQQGLAGLAVLCR